MFALSFWINYFSTSQEKLTDLEEERERLLKRDQADIDLGKKVNQLSCMSFHADSKYCDILYVAQSYKNLKDNSKVFNNTYIFVSSIMEKLISALSGW